MKSHASKVKRVRVKAYVPWSSFRYELGETEKSPPNPFCLSAATQYPLLFYSALAQYKAFSKFIFHFRAARWSFQNGQ